MLKINIVCIGKIKEDYIKNGINEFLTRIKPYANINIFELKEIPDSDIKVAKSKETNTILQFLEKKNGFNILLDIRGKQLSSEELAEKIINISNNYSTINYIIGGSNGVEESLEKFVDFRFSFSKMTFPHQLIRLILVEQIYRALSINNNTKYHK